VPEPTLDEQLRFAAARYALDVLPGEEIVALARQFFRERSSAPLAVCVLATVSDPHPKSSDLRPLFEEWLQVRDMPVPSPEDAIWDTIRCWSSRIAHGQVPPLGGLQGLVNEVGEKPKFGIERLVGAYRQRRELDTQPTGEDALADWDRAVIDDARDWLRDHPASA